MRKRTGAGFPVETIGRAIANSRPVRSLLEKLKERLDEIAIGQGRAIARLIAAVALIVILLSVGFGSWTQLHYTPIQPVKTVGTARRQPPVKAFHVVWDSLMADPMARRRWDSLVRMRPGLMDTVRQLERMDSLSAK